MTKHHDLGRTVRRFAAIVALVCGITFLIRFIISVVGSNPDGTEASWALVGGPQTKVFTFVSLAAAALCYGRVPGHVVASIFAVLAGYQYYFWFTGTQRIMASANLSAIPGASFPGNHLIGAGPLDLVPLLSLISLLLLVAGGFLSKKGWIRVGEVEGNQEGAYGPG